MKSKYTLILLMLLFSAGNVLMAQNEKRKDTVAANEKDKYKWLEHVGNYIMGSPWSFSDPMRTTHVKILGTVGYGGAKDTYLSELNHSGFLVGATLTFDHPRTYYFKYPSHLYQDITLQLGNYDNSVNSSNMYNTLLNYSIGLLPRWYDSRRWALDATILYNLNMGMITKLANTNNVVDAKVSTGLDMFGRVLFREEIKGYPIRLSYSAQLSLLHATFHPEYGQSYYEYVSGDETVFPKIHCTFPGKRTYLKQRLLIDLPIRNSTLTLGVEQLYHGENLESHNFKHIYWQAVIGYSFDYISFSGNRSLRSKQLRNNFY